MYDKLNEQDRQLRAEADQLLNNRLLKILGRFGQVHITGSYALKLMTWRDLDIYVENENISVEDFFELGKQLASNLTPRKMSFKNTRTFIQENEPIGLYWGLRVGDLQETIWKIDIWAFDCATCLEKIDVCNKIGDLLTPESRNYILSLKDQLHTHPDYRDTITSMDIYDSVLFKNVHDLNGFWEYIREKKK